MVTNLRLSFQIALVIAALLLSAAAAKAHPAGGQPALHAPAAPAPAHVARATSGATFAPSPQLAANQLARSRIISVPFGFSEPLVLHPEQQTVTLVGPGACAAGQQLSVTVTITQTSGAAAQGQITDTCSGANDQGLYGSAGASAGPALALGAARACGVATTSDSGGMTDQMEWCRDVVLVRGTYLPVVRRP